MKLLDLDAILAASRAKHPAPPDTPENRAYLDFMAELRRVSDLPWRERQREFGDPDSTYRQALRAYEQIAGLAAAAPAGTA